MEQKLVKVFCGIKCEPRSDLCGDILLTINRREKRTALIKLWGFSIVGVVSLFTFLPGSKTDDQSIVPQDTDNNKKAILANNGGEIQKVETNILAGGFFVDDFGLIGLADSKGVMKEKFIQILPRPEFLNQ